MTEDQFVMMTASTEDLQRRWKLSREDIRKRRLELLGRSRPINEPWLRAVGSWGGVRTAAEIGALVQRTSREVRDYAKGMDLKVRTRSYQRTRHELAVRLWCDRGRALRESCREFGVLPVERYLLCSHLEDVLVAEKQTIVELLCGSVAELEAAWMRLPDPFVRERLPLEELFDAVEHMFAERD